VVRARERGSSTPRLGTVITAQSLPGDEAELTERAPAVADDDELAIEVVVEAEPSLSLEPALPAFVPQPLIDPEPSQMPDVLSAMRALHVRLDAGVGEEADVAVRDDEEEPTRLRDVVTAELVASASFDDASSDVVTSAPYLPDPAVHEALTWNPGPVTESAPVIPAPLCIFEPEPPLEPYAPAPLSARISDVSELLDSFHVSGAAEERELRGALKDLAGLELTPMPHPLVEEG
jgi:hypothetical protein